MASMLSWLWFLAILLSLFALLGGALWLLAMLPKIAYGRPTTTLSDRMTIREAKAVKTPMTIDGRLTWRMFQSGIAIAYQDDDRQKAMELWEHAPLDATPQKVIRRAVEAYHSNQSWLGERMDYELHVQQFETFLKDTYTHSHASGDFVLGGSTDA